MSIYDDWLGLAYAKDGTADKKLWDRYLPLEQDVYEELLSSKTNVIDGTVSELAERFDMPAEYICGFVDGINGCLNEEIDVKELEESSPLHISFEFDRLYKKMVEYKAEHLYTLPQWDNVIDAAERRDLYYAQKKSGTVIKAAQPGRNDPCPCGSGKKYKKCCGA